MDIDRQTEQSDKELFGPGDSFRLPAAPRVPALGGQGTEVHHTQIDEERKKTETIFTDHFPVIVVLSGIPRCLQRFNVF